nr:hypothetical protein [Tanacetum cinerariifolium]
MKIPDWMISKEMKQREHYRMYAEVFGIDVRLIQSLPTESTQGMHRTPSAPRSPTPKVDAPESSVPTRSTVIHLRLPQWKFTRLTPHALEARENVALVEKHLASEEIEKMVEGQEHVVDDSSIPRNDEHNILDTRLEPMSDKESPEVGITIVIVPVNVYDEEEEEDKIIDEELQGHYGYLFEHLRAKFMPRKSFVTLADHLHEAMADSLPTMVDKHIKEQVEKQVLGQVLQRTCRTPAVRPRDQDDHHDDAHPEGEKNDDEIPTKQVSQDIMEEVSLNVDEAKLKKITNEMLRQGCTSGDEHLYHIDHIKNFLKSEIVWESRKEILVSPHPRKTTPLVLSYQRDPKASTLSLINQDLYQKKGNYGPEKIVLSLRKFPAVVFNDDDIKERTSRWVNKYVKKFNPYARYGVEHWKNPHAKIFYIRKQKEPGKPKEIITRRANDFIVSITDPDFKNLNKNDIEDMYLLIMNEKVSDYAETRLLWSLLVFIKSSVIWEKVHDFQLGVERVLEGLKSYNNDVRYGYNQRDLTKDKVEYLKLFKEEIEDRLKYRRQIRRWESYVNGRPLGQRRERPE